MVITEQIDNGYRLSLMPNSSISWQGSLLFLALISFPISIIGITFFFYGAPIILPFAGLEILIVGTALYVVFEPTSSSKFFVVAVLNLITSTLISILLPSFEPFNEPL